ncbi:hypothetical protein S7335_1658 [Synechococcus sp. PCC 7335]|uniref:hypothetical protein n=1 Tax=Synechococcus sp. (strain ATCC 29403 / PCC 7335) TaxID=91464 RepID=UPI00017ED8F1|nr:hypothetical protein [Synechococcus sp. PCC 7335]EDX83961.1 hypothetical protein S7335_1658 [Synechococcus sp. PCC 7335]
MGDLGDQLDEWVQSVGQLQQLIANEAESATMISQQTDLMQPQLQAIIKAVEVADLSSAVEKKLRTYLTEAYRRLRLMKVEGMKLRAARTPATITQIREQLKAHLNQLQQFAIAMADEV